MNYRIVMAILSMFSVVAFPDRGFAQATYCDRNLSTLEDDVDATATDLEAAIRRIEALMADVISVEDGALRATVCPDGTLERTATQRDAIGETPAAGIVDRASENLVCTQSLVARVSADIAKAQAENNSAMVIRLNSISKRILDLDSLATALSIRANHLASRRGRLLDALNAVDANCTSMDAIYD